MSETLQAPLVQPFVAMAPANSNALLTRTKLKIICVTLLAVCLVLATALGVVVSQHRPGSSQSDVASAPDALTNLDKTVILSLPPRNLNWIAPEKTDETDIAIGTIIPIIGQVVNIGTKIWNLVVNNVATNTVTVAPSNAIPQGVSLSSLSFPSGSKYSQQHTIAWPGHIYGYWAKYTFEMEYQCGGTYKGKGAYLANVVPTGSDYVYYGQHLTVTMQMDSPTQNSEGVTQLSGTISATDSGLSSSQKDCSFTIFGDCSPPTFTC